jgi:hypothetical protein
MSTFIVPIFAAFAMIASGCLTHDHHHRAESRTGTLERGEHHDRARSCHPSQYWNGHRCIHKGKGHGARKHDD